MYYFKYIGKKFSKIISNRLLRILFIVILFCIGVYFQGRFMEIKKLSIVSFIIVLTHSLFLGILTRLFNFYCGKV